MASESCNIFFLITGKRNVSSGISFLPRTAWVISATIKALSLHALRISQTGRYPPTVHTDKAHGYTSITQCTETHIVSSVILEMKYCQ